MNKRNTIIALSVGFLFGTLAFYLLYEKASEMEQKTTPVEILVASDYIPPGSILKARMVGKKAVPETFVSPGAIHDLQEVGGLMTLVPISAGEPILSNNFGTAEASLSAALNRGYRAYTLEVNETSGVGNLIRPGNHVDILTRMETDKKVITSFVYQNVQVLAVGQKMIGARRLDRPQETADSQGGDPDYGTVTLAVIPEQAETLMFLEGHPLRLILRGSGDEEIVSIPSQSEAEVLSKLGRFVPKAGHNIQIIRGNSKQED